jgi:GTP cyclohydrolase II
VHGNHFTGNLPLGEKHFENIVPEDGLQLFQFQRRSDAKHAAVAVKAAVRHEDVAVRIEPEEVTEGLHGDDGAGDGISFRH